MNARSIRTVQTPSVLAEDTDNHLAAEGAGPVLIIDDNADVAHVMKTILAEHGYEVVLAKDGTEGIKFAHCTRPAVIFCDEVMPGLDGYATLLRLRVDPATASIPVIMVGSTTANGLQDWQAAGAVDYLSKPFEIREIMAALARHLSSRGSSALVPCADTGVNNTNH